MSPREEVMSRNLLMSLRMVITRNSWDPPSPLLCRQHFKLQCCTFLLNKSTSSVCLSSLVMLSNNESVDDMFCLYTRWNPKLSSLSLDTIPVRQCPPNKPVYCIQIFPGHLGNPAQVTLKSSISIGYSEVENETLDNGGGQEER